MFDITTALYGVLVLIAGVVAGLYGASALRLLADGRHGQSHVLLIAGIAVAFLGTGLDQSWWYASRLDLGLYRWFGDQSQVVLVTKGLVVIGGALHIAGYLHARTGRSHGPRIALAILLTWFTWAALQHLISPRG